jgi:SAM-dependent methyltransferase
MKIFLIPSSLLLLLVGCRRQTDAYHHHHHPNSNAPTSQRRNNNYLNNKVLEDDVALSSPVSSQSSRADFLKVTATMSAAATASCFGAFPSASHAMQTDPKTGIALPSPGEIEQAIPKDWASADNPLEDGDPQTMFSRLDATSDAIFYQDPRFVEHVDDNAVRLMTEYISKTAVRPGDSVLDLCSSWTSHMDSSVASQMKRVAGLGMNDKELKANSALTDWVVQDLNANPSLSARYPDNSFNVILCQLSIDYLTRPLEVLKEAGRVLVPGGTIHILFSNRLFLSKAVGLWTGKDDIDHAYTVGCYLHFCNGGFENIQAKDLSTRKGRDGRIVGDPLYVVRATKR